MMIGHIMGLPVEESVVQLVPAGAVVVSMATIGVRVGIGRLMTRLRSR